MGCRRPVRTGSRRRRRPRRCPADLRRRQRVRCGDRSAAVARTGSHGRVLCPGGTVGPTGPVGRGRGARTGRQGYDDRLTRVGPPRLAQSRRRTGDRGDRRGPAGAGRRSPGEPVSRVAIPFGSYDRHVLRRLRQAKVSRAYTSDGGRAKPDAWLQPRNSLRHDLDAAWIRRVLNGSPSLHVRARRLAARTVKRLRGYP